MFSIIWWLEYLILSHSHIVTQNWPWWPCYKNPNCHKVGLKWDDNGWHANAMYFVHLCSLCQQEVLATRPPVLQRVWQDEPAFPKHSILSLKTCMVKWYGTWKLPHEFLVCPLLNAWRITGRFWAHWTDDQLSFGALPSLGCQQKSQEIAVFPDSILDLKTSISVYK